MNYAHVDQERNIKNVVEDKNKTNTFYKKYVIINAKYKENSYEWNF